MYCADIPLKMDTFALFFLYLLLLLEANWCLCPSLPQIVPTRGNKNYSTLQVNDVKVVVFH